MKSGITIHQAKRTAWPANAQALQAVYGSCLQRVKPATALVLLPEMAFVLNALREQDGSHS